MRHPKSAWAVAAALLLTAACSSGTMASTGTSGPPDACPAGKGTPMKGVYSSTLPCLGRSGTTMHVSAVHGRPEVVNFWASWCPPCKREIPLLQRVHTLAGRSVLFVGVDVKDKQSKALGFLAQSGATYPQVFDVTGSFPISLRMYELPDTLIVDRSGNVVFRQVGPVSEAQLRQGLAKAGVRLP